MSLSPPAVTPTERRLPDRADLDGLRGVAVLAVLLFHANLGLPGGYVGVDVFFVISGYLITSLLIRDIHKGEFSFGSFWERRLRRLVPPLLPVVIATLIAGWFILLPDDFRLLGSSVASLPTMTPNIWFWRNGGYFNPTSESKPLLHLWSLGVEGQFYLIYPVVLVCLMRFQPRRTFVLLLLLAVLSFGLNLYGSIRYPGATYFLLPTRAWELLAGALLCLLPPPGDFSFSRQIRSLIGAAGLAGILIASLVLNETTVFPGFAALLPCLGAAAVIWSGSSSTPADLPEQQERLPFTTSVLGWKPLRRIGLISYALYLWHWPLLVFPAYTSVTTPGLTSRTTSLLLAFMLAECSWRFIEAPIRQRRLLTTTRSVVWSALGIAATCWLAGLGIMTLQGFPGRFPREIQMIANARHEFGPATELSLDDILHGRLIEVTPEQSGQPIHCLLWGDSHAMSLIPAIRLLGTEAGVRCIAATRSSTLPLLRYRNSGRNWFRQVEDYNAAILEHARQQRIPHVILAGHWLGNSLTTPACADSPDCLESCLVDTVRALTANGTRVWIVRQIPGCDVDVPRGLAQLQLRGLPASVMETPADEFRLRCRQHNEVIDRSILDGVTLIDPCDLLITDQNRCAVQRFGTPLYSDRGHLSRSGAEFLAPLLAPIFERPDARDAAATGPNPPIPEQSPNALPSDR